MDFGEHFIDIERENLRMTQVQEKWDSLHINREWYLQFPNLHHRPLQKCVN